MKDNIRRYLISLDKVLGNIPNSEKILKKELISISYSLINSNNILDDIVYIDYLICYTFDKRYINNNLFLEVGMVLGDVCNGLKVRN